MKKLFTLIALFACLLGAKAITVTDVEVDFSKMPDGDASTIKFYGWGASEEAKSRLSIKNGCLHFESTEATTNSWDAQFHPIGGVDAEEGVTYTLHYKVKGSVTQNISALGFGTNPYGQFPITTEWVEGTYNYVAEKGSDGSNPSGDILMQCGDYIGEWDIAYLKITHEEKEQKPVEWVNMLTNGDASGEYGEVPCVQSKEFGDIVNVDKDGKPAPHAAEITTVDGKKVFVCHAKAVNPILTWDSEGEQWGQKHNAGDPMPDNAWQNQIWITFPRAMKADEQVKVTFKYKASKAVKTDLQSHRLPGDYLGGFTPGNITFSTDWQEFEKVFSASADMQSIAFNLGTEVYTEDMDFYLSDVTASLMKLEEGYFVASTNTESGLVEYDFDTATKFELDDDVYVATVGTVGNENSWVNEVMISTVRGNDKAFKAATLKLKKAVKNDKKFWIDFEAGSGAKIKLPAAGVWTISIDPDGQMNFVKLEGEPDKEAIVINPNPNKVVVEGTEREYLKDEAPEGYEFKKNDNDEPIYGQPWDNQFCIRANRALKAGESIVVSFKYKATNPASVNTQIGGEGLGAWMAGEALGTIDFTAEEQPFTKTFTATEGMQTITFNMAVIKEANTYEVYDIVWKLEDGTESLIDQESGKNFFVKVAAGNFTGLDEETGIQNVAAAKKNAPAGKFNIAGQRVSDNYKGVVVEGGRLYLSK